MRDRLAGLLRKLVRQRRPRTMQSPSSLRPASDASAEAAPSRRRYRCRGRGDVDGGVDAVETAPLNAVCVPDLSSTLGDWLNWLERLHPVEIDLGLERAARVARRAGLLAPTMPLITVAGTNGKGSTVAMLAAVYRAAGYRTGDYTSPHIERFNERIRLQGQPVEAARIVKALQHVEAHRQGESLTYFEFTTLAAMVLFREAGCEVVVLEVGLGGRLDTTNLWDADCAIVTSIALDP